VALAAALLVAALGRAEPCCEHFPSTDLSADQARVLSAWLVSYPTYRMATDDDNSCPDAYFDSDIRGPCEAPEPTPGYHPYQAVGDFNGDGATDFAVVLIDTKRSVANFALVIFNGPLSRTGVKPAMFQAGLKLGCGGLLYGPPGKNPRLILIAPLESNAGGLLVPKKATYRWGRSVCE
jgi:hypothetical protein